MFNKTLLREQRRCGICGKRKKKNIEFNFEAFSQYLSLSRSARIALAYTNNSDPSSFDCLPYEPPRTLRTYVTSLDKPSYIKPRTQTKTKKNIKEILQDGRNSFFREKRIAKENQNSMKITW